MCGRYTISTPYQQLALRFGVREPLDSIGPRYNAAPGQLLPVITNDHPSTVELFRWGLVPYWAKDPKIGHRLINARSETAAIKPSFRRAWRRRRCLVLADGFYEWQNRPGGKQPLRISIQGEEPFAMAGLWEHWHDTEGQDLRTFTILTTEPNGLLAPIHNRMPVILARDYEKEWLNGPTNEVTLNEMLGPYRAKEMKFHPVSTRVNSPQNDDQGLIVATRQAATLL